jgi:hypothetical protein
MAQNIQVNIIAKDKFTNIARNIRTATDRMGKSVKKLSSKFKNLSKSAAAFGKKAGALGKTLSLRVTAPITAGFALAIKSFSDGELATEKLKTAFGRLRGEIGVSLKKSEEFARTIQNTTTLNEDQIKGLQTTILGFDNVGKITQARFEDLTKFILNFAEVSGRGLITAGTNLGIAFANPEKALSFFETRGVSLGKKLPIVIKALIATGQTTAALTLLSKRAAKAFEGAAEAAGKTFAGRVIILKNAFLDMLKPIGRLTTEFLTPLIIRLTDLFRRLQKVNPKILAISALILSLVAAIAPVLIGIAILIKGLQLLGPAFALVRIAMIAMMTTPLGAAVAGITILIVALIFNLEKVERVVTNVAASFRKKFAPAIDFASRGIEKVFNLSSQIGGVFGKGAPTPTGPRTITAGAVGLLKTQASKILVDVNIRDRNGNVASVRKRATGPVSFDTGLNMAGV